MRLSASAVNAGTYHSGTLSPVYTADADATQMSSRVESRRRRCVQNSPLVGDSFDESEQICQQRVELRVNAPDGSRRELVENCVHTADADPRQLESCVASAVCRPIGH